MNKAVKTLFLFLLLSQCGEIDAQIVARKANEKTPSYPIAGSHLLQKDNAIAAEYFRQHPEAIRQMRLRKAAWSFSVGSTYTWKSVNFSDGNTFFNVPSTCRAVGTHSYIFVEDASWGTTQTARVNQSVVDAVKKAFDDSTPADTSKGIYQMDVDAFGDPPDVDGDSKIIILILDIKDGYDGSGGYVAGYFHSVNELPKSANSNSNEAEIYYLDSNPAALTTPSGLIDGMSTTAHEFQHMIHWNYNRTTPTSTQFTFINEGSSLIAEVNAGYPLYSQTGFTSEPNHYLFDWRFNDNENVLRDYSRAAKYMLYLRDQFSMNIFKPLVQTTVKGPAAIDTALKKAGNNLNFKDATRNWFIANGVNSQSINSAYGYVYPNVSLVAMQTYLNPNVASTSRDVRGYAADYLSFENGSNLSVTFTLPSGSTLEIKAVKIGTGGTEIVDVAAGTPFQVSDFGSTYSKVRFIILNPSSSVTQSYTVQASGTVSAVELKYDNTEPAGYLRLTRGDIVAVVFDAVPGATLDSVRVALRRTGTMKGGVWKYTGVVQPTPLGTAYVTNISASVSSTPGVPYPVPWPNWGTVNLTSNNIMASDPFVVAFTSEGDSTTQPRVMITESPEPSKVTSLTYLSSEGKWFYITSNDAGDSVYTYLIRAYLSFINTGGIKETIEIVPGLYSLRQNYPNPFNPVTRISYQIPSEGYVTLTVFDMLGRIVTTLVSEVEQAGEHNVEFNARGLSSGIYFYTLRTNNFVQTKKLMLLQ